MYLRGISRVKTHYFDARNEGDKKGLRGAFVRKPKFAPMCSDVFGGRRIRTLVRDDFCLNWSAGLARCTSPRLRTLAGRGRNSRQRISGEGDSPRTESVVRAPLPVRT